MGVGVCCVELRVGVKEVEEVGDDKKRKEELGGKEVEVLVKEEEMVIVGERVVMGIEGKGERMRS